MCSLTPEFWIRRESIDVKEIEGLHMNGQKSYVVFRATYCSFGRRNVLSFSAVVV